MIQNRTGWLGNNNGGKVLLLVLLIVSVSWSQNFTVSGSVHTSTMPVQNASVTFIDQSDTSKKYSTLTDSNGNFQISIVTGVASSPAVPQTFKLAQNYPNPFSSSTAIAYQLDKQADVKVTIYDILGREIKRFTVGLQTAGVHGVTWDGKNNFGRTVATGIYFYRLQTKDETQVKEMVYTGWNIGMSIPLLNNNLHSKVSWKKETAMQTMVGTYSVQIQNVNGTKPKILASKYSNVGIEQGTTLNFEVQLGSMAYSFCYQRQDTISYNGMDNYLVGSVYLNNTIGTNKKVIINSPLSSESKGWSPDGKYIAINHEDTLGIGHAYLYDVANDSLITDLVPSPDDTVHSGILMWTPDERIIYGERNLHEPVPGRFYIMDMDGSNKKILTVDPSYVYPDNYSVLCYVVQQTKGYSVYHSNLDGSVYELLVDLTQFVNTSSGYVSIYDVNPHTNELLLVFDDPSTILPNMVAKYHIAEQHLDTIMVPDSGWKCYTPTFSHDFKKIEIQEANTDSVNGGTKILLFSLEDSTETAIMEFPHKNDEGKTQFCGVYSTFAFSSDDKYLAFPINVVQNKPGQMIRWISYLYIVELATKQATIIDAGILPQWNPLKGH